MVGRRPISTSAPGMRHKVYDMKIMAFEEYGPGSDHREKQIKPAWLSRLDAGEVC